MNYKDGLIHKDELIHKDRLLHNDGLTVINRNCFTGNIHVHKCIFIHWISVVRKHFNMVTTALMLVCVLMIYAAQVFI